MDIYSNYLQIIPKASFTAIYLSDQIFGEVDPTFVNEFCQELHDVWSFIDYKDKLHLVTFNGSLLRPLLTNGWIEMKDVFGFDINQKVEFVYYGNSTFGLICSKTLECSCQIPMYHSRFIKFGYTVQFYLELSADVINKPFLNIFGSFEEYVRQCNFKFIAVCCDNGKIHIFDVAVTDEPFKTTSIGMGWEDLCASNHFVVGDFLCFKFTIIGCSNMVYVYKI